MFVGDKHLHKHKWMNISDKDKNTTTKEHWHMEASILAPQG